MNQVIVPRCFRNGKKKEDYNALGSQFWGYRELECSLSVCPVPALQLGTSAPQIGKR
jgi:hypothetical protein